MKDQPQLTPLQLDVLQVLWERGEATVNDVTDALRAPRGLAPTTVATLLARLERRGVVKRRRVDRQFRYAALVQREEAQRTLVDELAKSLFDGDLGGLVHHLVARDEISADDLARVRTLLDEKADSAAGPDGAGPDGAGPDGAGPDGTGPDGSGGEAQ